MKDKIQKNNFIRINRDNNSFLHVFWNCFIVSSFIHYKNCFTLNESNFITYRSVTWSSSETECSSTNFPEKLGEKRSQLFIQKETKETDFCNLFYNLFYYNFTIRIFFRKIPKKRKRKENFFSFHNRISPPIFNF